MGLQRVTSFVIKQEYLPNLDVHCDQDGDTFIKDSSDRESLYVSRASLPDLITALQEIQQRLEAESA